jgi:hypothetical protein
VEGKEGMGGGQAVAPTPRSGRMVDLMRQIKQFQIKRKLLPSQQMTTPSGRAKVPMKNCNLNGVLRVLGLLSVVRTRMTQVSIRLSILMMGVLVLLVIREFHVRSVVFTIMLLRTVVDCSVRFVGSITTPLTTKDVSHVMLVLNCVLLK